MEKLIRNDVSHSELYQEDELEWREPVYDVWDGTHVMWTDGDGSYENPFRIRSAKNLAYLSHIVATNWQAVRDKVIRQEVDIDMNNIPFRPIGGRNSAGATSGTITATFTYQGNNKRIKNLKLKTDSSAYYGLFGLIWFGHVSNLKVINVDMDDTLLNGTMYSAGLVGAAAASCIITNCHVLGKSNIKGRVVGGIVGIVQQGTVSSMVISNCSVGKYTDIITTTALSHFAGGIGGNMNSGGLRISDCVNYSNIKTLSPVDVGGRIGGIFGAHNSAATLIVEKCTNFGNIINGSGGGGICGNIQNGSITKCANLGSVDCFNIIGGIAGGSFSNNITINSCFNIGKLNSIKNGYFDIGGIVGYNSTPTLNVVNSYSIGVVDGSAYGESVSGCSVSSVIGYTQSGGTVNMSNVFVNSEIIKSNRLTATHGSLIGYLSTNTIVNFNNVFVVPKSNIKPVPNHPQYDNTEVTYEYLLGNSLESLFGNAWEYTENKLPIIKL